MNNDATILYYTSNREDERFENKIRENLLKVCGNLPIISISHKPINLGTNICVGNVGVSGYNMFRQVLIGCGAAKTRFIISAEADCLYPPDYFTFRPERDDVCYQDNNLYVMGFKRDYVNTKMGATHAQIIGREFYIDLLKKLFDGAPMWCPEEKNFPKERHKKEDVFSKILYWRSDNPVVQIKTGDSMRYHTASGQTPVYNIPYWGDTKKLRNNLFK
jgi:hypothetical protein